MNASLPPPRPNFRSVLPAARSDAMQRRLANDPELAARVALWDSCGLYVRAMLLKIRLQVARGAL